MIDVLVDAISDSVKLLPFLWITYVIMEYLEHKTQDRTRRAIKKSGKYGPLIGSILGIFPQCGFSVSATNLYAARVITLGTLIAVYLSTSDEMLPIFLSEAVPISTIVSVLVIKLVVGMIAGFLIDFVMRLRKKEEEEKIIDLCEKEHCHCEHGLIKSALRHTFNIFFFILLINVLMNIVVYGIGEEHISEFLQNQPILGPVLAGLIGLIPNCVSSVILTQMYLENVISVATMISGLLVGAGVGLAVLFKMNQGIKRNLQIVALLYSISVVVGIIIELIGIRI